MFFAPLRRAADSLATLWRGLFDSHIPDESVLPRRRLNGFHWQLLLRLLEQAALEVDEQLQLEDTSETQELGRRAFRLVIHFARVEVHGLERAVAMPSPFPDENQAAPCNCCSASPTKARAEEGEGC